MKQLIHIELQGLSVSASDMAEDVAAFVNLILTPHKGVSLEDFSITFDPPVIEKEQLI